MHHVVAYAEHQGRVVHVDNVQSGLGCDCRCLNCFGQLVARKGPVLAHHFAHRAGIDCQGLAEGALHRLAKEILCSGSDLWIPAYRWSRAAKLPGGNELTRGIELTRAGRPRILESHREYRAPRGFMKLHRFASIEYDDKLSAEWRHFGLTADAVDVKVWPAKQTEGGLIEAHFVQATTQISPTRPSSEAPYEVPEKERAQCERAIEILANHIALFRRVRRRIFSIDPVVALEPETEEDRAILQEFNLSRKARAALGFFDESLECSAI